MACSRPYGCVNTLSDYSTIKCTGKGTYGSVFKAIHIPTGDTVALKSVVTRTPMNKL